MRTLVGSKDRAISMLCLVCDIDTFLCWTPESYSVHLARENYEPRSTNR